MLEVKNLSAAYGLHSSLNDVSICISSGEIVTILGANGAGKSTLLRAIAGICEGQISGEISLENKSLMGLSPDEIVEKGIALVPEGRGIFSDLTVKENMLLGAHPARAREKETENLNRVFELFPKLQERQNQIVRTMSGGEQQMVAIGRALMSKPETVLLDEPSMGLAPQLVEEIFQIVKDLNEKENVTFLLAEQNTNVALRYAHYGYILESGRVVMDGPAAELRENPDVKEFYLGMSDEGRKSFRNVRSYRRRKRWLN